MSTRPAPIELARNHLRHGRAPVPVRGKVPWDAANWCGLAEWQTLVVTEPMIEAFFGSTSITGCGVLNGARSKDLLDTDLDAAEAVAAAPAFLPATNCIFGRASRRRSHYIYRAPGVRTMKFRDVPDGANPKGATLVELRSTGTQTIWPGSLRLADEEVPQDEMIAFEVEGDPQSLDGADLLRSVRHVAVCSLLARHWPTARGCRHDLALSVAGFLLRRGVDMKAVITIITTAARIAGDIEWHDRERAARDTAEQYARGARTTGAPTVASLLGAAAVQRLGEWLPTDSADRRSGADFSAAYKDGGAAEKTLPFRTAAEIARETIAGVRWATKPWLAFGAATELAGKIKAAGKTTFATHMCRRILDGEAFLGQPTTRSPIIWLTEQPPASFRETLRRADLLDREDFVVLYAHEATGVAWQNVATATVAEAERRGAKVIVVDTLGRFANLQGESENHAGAAEAAVQALVAQATARGIAILLIRHERKSGGDVGDAARGSSAFGGAVDIVLLLRRLETAPRKTIRVLLGLSRFDETPDELVVELVDGGYVSLGTPENLARKEARGILLTVLPADSETALAIHDRKEKKPNGQTGEVEEVVQKGFCSLTGLKKTFIEELLRRLEEEGLVGHVGEGKRGAPRRYYLVNSSAGKKSYRAAEKTAAPNGAADNNEEMEWRSAP